MTAREHERDAREAARAAERVVSAARAFRAMVRHDEVKVYGGASGLAAWDALDAALDALACQTCGGTQMVGTGQPSDEGGEAWSRCPDCP